MMSEWGLKLDLNPQKLADNIGICMHIHCTSSWTCISNQWNLNPPSTWKHAKKDGSFKSNLFSFFFECYESNLFSSWSCTRNQWNFSLWFTWDLSARQQGQICQILLLSCIFTITDEFERDWNLNLLQREWITCKQECTFTVLSSLPCSSSRWNLNSWHTWKNANNDSPSNQIPVLQGHALEINGTSIDSKLEWHLQSMPTSTGPSKKKKKNRKELHDSWIEEKHINLDFSVCRKDC